MAQNPTVKVGFLGDASQLAREAKRAEAALAGIDRRAHITSTALGTAFGTVAGRGIGALAGAARNAIGSIGGLASASIQAASDMNESLSKNRQVFGESAETVKAWANDSTKNILLTKQAAIEGAATFGNLFVALGLGKPAAADLSTSLVGLAQDLSSFNNVGTDEALLALRSGLLGEAEPLRKFGVSLSQARIESEAFALGLAKPVKNAAAITAAHNAVAAATAKVAAVEKEHGKDTLAAAQARDGLARANAALSKALGGQKTELTAAQKAQAAYSIIVKDTATAAGDAAHTQDGYANSTKKLHKNIGDLEASIGQKLLPHALRLTHAISDLVVEFDNGTGTGGEIRDALAGIGQTARDIGDDLKPVVGVMRWFADHPDALKGAVEGMVAYRIATKSAALWSERLAAANVAAKLTGVATVAPVAATAVGGLAGAVAGLTLLDVAGWGAAAYGVFNRLSGVVKGLRGDISDLIDLSADPFALKPKHNNISDADVQKYVDGLSPEKKKQFYGWFPEYSPPGSSATTASERGQASKNRAGLEGIDQRDGTFAASATRAAAAQKAATDKVIAQQKYAADQAEAAAKRKAEAAAALSAATDKLRDALQDRLDTAKGIRDSLISSNSIVRDGVSWTAKDLLARFTVTMGKVKRFQTALSSLVHKGFDPTIVQQVAAAGVQGGLGTAVGLAHASAGQVRQINATQRAINAAAGGAGDRVAGQMGPIRIENKLVIGGREIQLLATEVNRWNARNGYNGHSLAS